MSEKIDNLEQNPFHSYIESLIKVFRKGKKEDCNSAIEVLSSIGKASVAPLVSVLDDESIAYWVVQTLGELEDVEAIEPLINVMKSEDSELGFAAAEAVSKIGNEAIPFLISALKNLNWNLRSNATYALGLLKASKAVMPIVRILDEEKEDYILRGVAVSALGEIRSKQAVEVLLPLLNDDFLNIRVSSIVALGKIGDKRAVEPMINILNSEDNEIRFLAVSALSNLKDPRALPALEKIAQNDEGEVYWGKIRNYALKAIKQIQEQNTSQK